MGIALPQLAPASEDRVSGAQIIDGSLKFDSSKTNYLSRTPGSAGNRRTWTWSGWVKRSSAATSAQAILGSYDSSSLRDVLRFTSNNLQLQIGTSGGFVQENSSAVYRDIAWYHITTVFDSTQATAEDRVRIYVNSLEQTLSGTPVTQNTQSTTNNTDIHYIGARSSDGSPSSYLDGSMSQVNFIDGAVLGPENFGYTDPLTNTWRPKKFSAFNNPNNGTTWSNSVSGTEEGGWSKTQSFDGELGSSSRASTGNSLTFTPSSPIPVNTSLRIYGRRRGSYSNVFTVNGTDYSSLLTSSEAFTANIPVSNITSIVWSNVNGNSNSVDIGAIEVDGYSLLDGVGDNSFYLPMDGNSPIGEDKSGQGNNWTPVNFGGSNSLDKATGAKPILNTTAGVVARPGVFGSEVGFRDTVSSSSGGGNPYIFDGRGTQPTLSFIRGATYVFDYSSATSHPLRFATAADAAGSTEYTDGTSVSGNVISFTVPHNAPNTLYYYCTNHSGMGNSISVTTDETKADPYAWKCTLAIPFISDTKDYSGDINCTVSSKTTSSDNLTFSTPGDMFYGSPAKLLGNGSSNSRVLIASGAFGFGTGDFTIEFWGHLTATGDQGNRNARIVTPQSESGTYIQILTATSGTKTYLNNVDIPNDQVLNKTRHFVFQRTGTTGTLLVDGVLVDSGTEDRNFADVAYQIGRYDASNGGASMYMADFRVYTGVEKYSTTGKSVGDQIFTPASTSPDILPDTPSGVSGSSKLTKITDGAAFINRASDGYLQAPASTDFRLDGQYCIEYFLNLSDYSNDSVYVRTFVLDGPTGDGGTTNIHLNVNPSTGVVLFWSGSGELISGTISIAGGWHHVCLTRDSSNKTRLFIDGVLSGSADIATDYNLNTNQNRPRLGALGSTGGTTGYYSNWRIIKGSIPTEYQTSTTTNGTRAFYPPFRTLTNVTNTKLLCCQSNTSATTATVTPGSITENGSPAATNFNPFNTDINTVRGQETGYATLNHLSTAVAILTNGNLTYEGGSGQHCVGSTFAVSSGKWYWESFVEPTGNYFYTGIADVNTSYTGNWCGSNSGWSVSVNSAGNICYGGAENLGSIGISVATGQIWSWALDMDAGTFKVYVDGVIRYSGNSIIPGATSLSGRTVTPATGHDDGRDLTYNFGQKPFKFPPPAGFQSLNDASVRPETVITRPDQYFGLKLWTGNGQSSLVVGGGDYIITPNPKDNGSYSSREPYDMFDGSTSTYWQAAASNHRYQLMTFSPPKTGSKIELSVLASNGWDGFEINGSVPGSLPGTGSQSWYDITSHTGGSLSSIRIAYTSGNHTQLVYALRIDDTIVTNQVLGTDPYQFSPDLVWVKGRNATHYQSWIDTIRGGTKILFSNTNNAEETQSAAITSFNSNGFSVSNWGAVNTDANSYVAWAWKAGGSKGTWNKDDVAYASAAAAGLTGITSPATLTAASIGTKQGFSIIRWNRGADHPSWSTGVIPHGLTQAPNMIITKNLASGSGWMVFHSSKGTGRLYLNDSGVGDGSGYTTLPTATHFTIDSTSDANTAADCMSYCWHDVPGLQKFGKYIGNNNADGPFIELGFRPSVIIIKRSDGGTLNWTLWDAARNSENVMGRQLYPNLSDVEADAGTNTSYGILDFVSNGVKIRGTHSSFNSSTHTFIYAAWAEAPEFNLYGAQSNAR